MTRQYTDFKSRKNLPVQCTARWTVPDGTVSGLNLVRMGIGCTTLVAAVLVCLGLCPDVYMEDTLALLRGRVWHRGVVGSGQICASSVTASDDAGAQAAVCMALEAVVGCRVVLFDTDTHVVYAGTAWADTEPTVMLTRWAYTPRARLPAYSYEAIVTRTMADRWRNGEPRLVFARARQPHPGQQLPSSVVRQYIDGSGRVHAVQTDDLSVYAIVPPFAAPHRDVPLLPVTQLVPAMPTLPAVPAPAVDAPVETLRDMHVQKESEARAQARTVQTRMPMRAWARAKAHKNRQGMHAGRHWKVVVDRDNVHANAH